MAYETTEGPDRIELETTYKNSPSTEVIDMKGGDDKVVIRHFRSDPEDPPSGFAVQYEIDGGEGMDTLEVHLNGSEDDGGDEFDAKTGDYYEFSFSSFERFVIYGSSGGDLMYGSDGDDFFDGGGEKDRFEGRGGNDTYIVDALGDSVVEANKGGRDTVVFLRALQNYELPENVEVLVLRYSGDGFGNDQANEIIGGTGHNTMLGRGGDDILRGMEGDDILKGGAGLDTMYGGDGDDLMVVNDRGEGAFGGRGTDTVESSVSHALRGSTERLILTGTAANGSGNELDNFLQGNDAANILSGLDGDDRLDGGIGADTLRGGDGNDRYFVDNIGDSVQESEAAGGIDTVISTVSFALGANVENLTLDGRFGIDGTGNGQANRIIGNVAANEIRGKGGDDRLQGQDGDDRVYGGDGDDRIYGGRGNDILRGDEAGGPRGEDRFYFNTSFYHTENVDRILDFNPADDLIVLSKNVFEQLAGPGTLSAANFRVGASAADADDFIIYNPATGAIFYDPDGAGEGNAQVQFARVTAGTDLTNADFFVFG